MWLGLILIVLSWIVAYISFRSKGTLVALVIMLIALGLSVFALPFITASNTTTYPAILITSPSGNTLINTYNVTSSQTIQNQSLIFIAGEVNAIVEVGIVFIIMGYLFWDRDKKKKERYNS